MDTDRYVSQMSSSRSSAASTRSGPAAAIHASFTCGRPTDFDRPPSENASTSLRSSTRPAARRAPRRQLVVGKDLIRHERQIVGRRKFCKALDLVRLDERAGRIVGRHDQNRARARRDRSLERFEVDAPSRVGVEIVGTGRHPIEAGQMIEQRITRPRDEHLVAGIGQELEEASIGLARARRQRDPSGVTSIPRLA